MDCRKCGSQIIDGALFCSKCGARQDGKVACKNCGKEIPEDSVFCAFCGKRLDGKEVCSSCGTVICGDFCHVCGKANSTVKTQNTKESSSASQNWKKVLGMVRQSLLYGAICIMFICCFFVSLIQFSEIAGEKVETIGSTSFYFLIESFIEVGDTLSLMNNPYVELEIGLWMGAILMALPVAVIMTTSSVSFIIGSVKFISACVNKKQAELGKLVSVTAIINLSAIIFLRSVLLTESVTASTRTAFGAVPILEIIFVSFLLTGAAVCCLIENGLKNKKLVPFILNIFMVVVAFLLIETVSTKAIALGTSLSKVVLSASSFVIGIFVATGQVSADDLAFYGRTRELSFLMFIIYFVLFVLIVLVMCQRVIRLIDENKKEALGIVGTMSCFMFAVAYFVVAIITAGEEAVYMICASPIFALIFSIMLVVLTFVGFVFRLVAKNKERELLN